MTATQIVVADDADEILALVTEVLEDAGYDVLAVRDGHSALDSIRSREPALALLDVAMPAMLGDEVLRQLRDDGVVIPIVIMTAVPNAQRFIDDGATAVLTKPFDLDQLLSTIADALAPEKNGAG